MQRQHYQNSILVHALYLEYFGAANAMPINIRYKNDQNICVDNIIIQRQHCVMQALHIGQISHNIPTSQTRPTLQMQCTTWHYKCSVQPGTTAHKKKLLEQVYMCNSTISLS